MQCCCVFPWHETRALPLPGLSLQPDHRPPPLLSAAGASQNSGQGGQVLLTGSDRRYWGVGNRPRTWLGWSICKSHQGWGQSLRKDCPSNRKALQKVCWAQIVNQGFTFMCGWSKSKSLPYPHRSLSNQTFTLQSELLQTQKVWFERNQLIHKYICKPISIQKTKQGLCIRTKRCQQFSSKSDKLN